MSRQVCAFILYLVFRACFPYDSVWGIPRDATREEMTSHFQRFGVVADCVVTQDRGKVMGTRMKRSKLLDKLISLKIDAAYYEAKERATMLRYQMRRIAKQKAAIIKCDKIIDTKMSKGFASVCAFVTFERDKDGVDVAKAYRHGSYLMDCCQKQELKFRGKYILKLRRAPESSDMLWENVIRVNPVVRITRKLISLACIFVLLMGAIAIVVYAKDSLDNAPPVVTCTSTVVHPIDNPTPILECAAIWPMQKENANGNVTSEARSSVQMFVANVKHDKCKDFITRGEWAKPMRQFAPYDGAKLANLPGPGKPWTGGWIPETQADECAALTCMKCYCTSVISFDNIQDLMSAYANGDRSQDFCKEIYDQIFLEAGVQLGTILVTVVTNMILISSAGFFSLFERHTTISATEANAALYTFIALFVNQALVPIIIYSLIEILAGFPFFFQVGCNPGLQIRVQG